MSKHGKWENMEGGEGSQEENENLNGVVFEVGMKSWIRSKATGQMSLSYVTRWGVRRKGEGWSKRAGGWWRLWWRAVDDDISRHRHWASRLQYTSNALDKRASQKGARSSFPPTTTHHWEGEVAVMALQNIWASNTNQIKTNCGIERFIKFQRVQVPAPTDAKWKNSIRSYPKGFKLHKEKQILFLNIFFGSYICIN